jgi:hypothetical protein
MRGLEALGQLASPVWTNRKGEGRRPKTSGLGVRERGSKRWTHPNCPESAKGQFNGGSAIASAQTSQHRAVRSNRTILGEWPRETRQTKRNPSFVRQASGGGLCRPTRLPAAPTNGVESARKLRDTFKVHPASYEGSDVGRVRFATTRRNEGQTPLTALQSLNQAPLH